MYALIYDEHNLEKITKPVLSVHETREAAEAALKKRQQELGRRVFDCNTRIVWVEREIRPGEQVPLADCSTWAPGEKVPEGEMYSDTD